MLALLTVISFTLYAFTLAGQSPLVAKTVHAAEGVNVWWPNDGVHLSGTQPFKAVVDGVAVEQYEMYWQVDGGQQNQMWNSPTDYPHKESSVDLSGWNWKGKGPYQLNFIAKQNGNVIAQKSLAIYNDGAQDPTPAPAPAAPSQEPVPAEPAPAQPPESSVSAPVAVTPPAPVQSAPVQVQAPASAQVEVWWPTQGSTLAGSQPLKAVVNGMPVEQYAMYWKVDGGELNLMQTVTTGGAHKESVIDVSGWNWNPSGTYTFSFVAKDGSGNTLGQQSVSVKIQNGVSAPAQSGAASQTTAPISGNPLSGAKFYLDPNSSASRQASDWRTSRPGDAALMDTLAAQPTAKWFGGWNGDVQKDVRNAVSAAAGSGSVAVLVAYNVPFRDCGGYSAGGATSASAYSSWIQSFANGIGSDKTVVILEPDGLSTIGCLSGSDQSARLAMLSEAVSTLKKNPNTYVYIDAGHSSWIDADTMAKNLKAAGIDKADGFALNVSNFMTTSDETNYGTQVSQKVGDKHFVVDTARNGNGSNGEWCNPWGRALGQKPTASTGNSRIDAYLWLKVPGESDGNCNGGPNAGVWWPDYALGLARNSR